MVDVRRVRRYIWICGLFCAALPASASGAVTIGSDLAATPDGVGSCSPDPCTSAHQVLPPSSTASGGLLAPSDGVVVRWRIKVGQLAAPVALRITRPGDSETRAGVATGATRNPGPNQVSVFDARLPIDAGDALGIDHPDTTAFASTAGAIGAFWNPPLGGAARTGLPENLELLVNADIEPDADGDGYGDETQDQCPTDASTHGTCPVIPPPDPPPDPDPDPQSRSLRLFVGHHPEVNKRVTVRATGFAEAPLKLWVSAAPGGGECPAGSSVQPPRAQRVLAGAVFGKFRVEKRFEMKRRGRHSFCGYLGPAGGSEFTTAFKTRLVRRPRLKARTARQTVNRALRRHEFAGRVVKNVKQRCKRSSRATFSCRFSSSFPGYRLTGRGVVRLNKRVSYRFRVRVRNLKIALTDKNEGRFPG